MTNDANIRLECLKPAERWAQPSGEEVREVLRLAGLTGGKAAKVLGLGPKGDRDDPAMGGRGHADPLCRVGAAVRLRRPRADLERGLTPGKEALAAKVLGIGLR
jgi:hypothetical protein